VHGIGAVILRVLARAAAALNSLFSELFCSVTFSSCEIQCGSVFSESQFSARASSFEFSVGAVLNTSSFPLINKL
jgi:hypothetical protein